MPLVKKFSSKNSGPLTCPLRNVSRLRTVALLSAAKTEGRGLQWKWMLMRDPGLEVEGLSKGHESQIGPYAGVNQDALQKCRGERRRLGFMLGRDNSPVHPKTLLSKMK